MRYWNDLSTLHRYALKGIFYSVLGAGGLALAYGYTTKLPEDEFSAFALASFIPGVIMLCVGFAQLALARGLYVKTKAQPDQTAKPHQKKKRKNRKQRRKDPFPGGNKGPFGGPRPTSELSFDIKLASGQSFSLNRRWIDSQMKALARLLQLDPKDFQLFQPQGAFYEHCAAGKDNPTSLIKAANMLLRHMGIDVLVMPAFTSTLEDEIGGQIDLRDEDGCYFISINNNYADNPQAIGAILAHELVHIYDEQQKLPKLGNIKDELNVDLLLHLKGLGLLPLLGARYEHKSPRSFEQTDGRRHRLTYLPWGLLLHTFGRIAQVHELDLAALASQGVPDETRERLAAQSEHIDGIFQLYQQTKDSSRPQPRVSAVSEEAPSMTSLLAMLNSPDNEAQQQAAMALSQRSEAVPLLIPLLHQAPVSTRIRAVEVLGALGPKAADAAVFLGAILHSHDGEAEHPPALQQRAAEALGYIGVASDLVCTGLCRQLEHPEASNRRSAAIALGRLASARDDVIDALKQRLSDEDELVINAVHETLSKLQEVI